MLLAAGLPLRFGQAGLPGNLEALAGAQMRSPQP